MSIFERNDFLTVATKICCFQFLCDVHVQFLFEFRADFCPVKDDDTLTVTKQVPGVQERLDQILMVTTPFLFV